MSQGSKLPILMAFTAFLTACAGKAGVPPKMSIWDVDFPPHRVVDQEALRRTVAPMEKTFLALLDEQQ